MELPEVLLYAAFRNKVKFDFEFEQFDCTVIFFLERGEYEFSIGELSGKSCPGEAVICPPGMIFRRKVTEPVDLHILRLVLPDHEKIDAKRIKIRDISRIKQDLSFMPIGIKHSFTEFERHFLLDIWYTLKNESDVRQVCDELMERGKRMLDENIRIRQPLGDIAELVGLSPVALTRRFRRAYGMTPNEYLIGQRIAAAQRLLCETDMSLAEIAEVCGYENEYYFSANFKKKVGVPPGAYRKSAFL